MPKFGSVNQDKIREDYLGLGSKTFQIPAGATKFRILPPHADAPGVWYRTVRRHLMFFGEGRMNEGVTCMEDGCPLCVLGEEYHQEGGENMTFADRYLRPKTQYFVNAVIYTSQGEFEFGKPYIMSLPTRVFKSVLTCEKDTADAWADITGIGEYERTGKLLGVLFKITKSGTGLKTTYELQPQPGRTDLLEDLRSRGVNVDTFDFANLEAVPWLALQSKAKLAELAEQVKKEHAVSVRGGFVGAATAGPARGDAPPAAFRPSTIQMPNIPLPPQE